MDYSEKWGSSIDEATRLALEELGVTIDDVEVIVLEEPSRGFFGIGSKLAHVRVEKKKVETPVVKEVKAEPKKEVKPSKKPNNNGKAKKDNVKKDVKKPEKVSEPVKASSKDEYADMETVTEHAALTFLNDLVRDMGIDVTITCKVKDDLVYVDIEGKDSSTVIGKRGQTLDSIQYLTSLVVNKGEGEYVRVVVDAEHYRAKREKTLEQLAQRLASKVKKSRKPMKLEPMNPYERKVIHATLQNHPYVTTRSEGEEPYRRVIIELKK
ncbi:MAG: protein jag [Clostridia bacterium]|nr:protein jag [Clostridia bacterium]